MSGVSGGVRHVVSTFTFKAQRLNFTLQYRVYLAALSPVLDVPGEEHLDRLVLHYLVDVQPVRHAYTLDRVGIEIKISRFRIKSQLKVCKPKTIGDHKLLRVSGFQCASSAVTKHYLMLLENHVIAPRNRAMI